MAHIPPENVYFYPSLPPGMAVKQQFGTVTGQGANYQLAIDAMLTDADRFQKADYVINVVVSTYAPQAIAVGLVVKMK